MLMGKGPKRSYLHCRTSSRIALLTSSSVCAISSPLTGLKATSPGRVWPGREIEEVTARLSAFV